MDNIVFISSPMALLMAYFDLVTTAPDAEAAKLKHERQDEPLWGGQDDQGWQLWFFSSRR